MNRPRIFYAKKKATVAVENVLWRKHLNILPPSHPPLKRISLLNQTSEKSSSTGKKTPENITNPHNNDERTCRSAI